jgi:hypothetical protein
MSDPFVGVWKYRSFLNQSSGTPQDLLFGEGVLTITRAGVTELVGTGTFGAPGELDVKLTGYCTLGAPPTIQMRATGTGRQNRDKWVYDYVGFLVPAWRDGIGQIDAIVGSVIRAHAYEDQNVLQPAGVTASFYAVKV